MRHHTTYRAAKRHRVKVWAKNDGVKFIAVWQSEEVPGERIPYRPDRIAGKTYAANGKQERARRLSRIPL